MDNNCHIPDLLFTYTPFYVVLNFEIFGMVHYCGLYFYFVYHLKHAQSIENKTKNKTLKENVKNLKNSILDKKLYKIDFVDY